MTPPTPKYLIVIAGPTAVGKTSLSIQLAQKLNTEIISADARQFYSQMVIGTAQPTIEEMRGIPHHFLGFLSVTEKYNAQLFGQQAMKRLDKLFAKNNCIILTGGSGLYIQAVCNGLAPLPTIHPEYRRWLNQIFQKKGIHRLQSMVQTLDPNYYAIVDLNNPVRLIRALEVILSTGIPYSTLRKTPALPRDFKVLYIGLREEKDKLHHRIDQRLQEMIDQGLLQEAEPLYPYKHTTPLQTIGYKELFAYMDGLYSLSETIRQIGVHTKQYAKKQLTWFRKNKSMTWFHPSEFNRIYNHIQEELSLRGRCM